MRKKIGAMVCMFALLVLAGCAVEGPTGPAGPTGATGATGATGTGDLSTYSFDLDPSFASGTFTNNSCPALDVSQSIVSCFLQQAGETDYITLPATVEESDPTTTKWTYKFKNGLVDIEYENSASTIPGDVTVYVNVINP